MFNQMEVLYVFPQVKMITIKVEKMMGLYVLSDKMVQNQKIHFIAASFLMLCQLCRHCVLQLVSVAHAN